MKPEIDEPSGQQTTGHEWNGIKELNTPVPWPFRVSLWGTIAFSILFWILYPAWPFVTGYTKGLLGYSSRVAVTEAVEKGAATRAEAFSVFQNEDMEALAADPSLREKFEPAISVLYRDNCSACHGRDLTGQINFPNLTDDHWLWSGSPEEIEQTLQVGINSTHDDTRYAEMPAFGRDEMLEKPDINDVVEYVLSLSENDYDQSAAERGAVVFEDNCASCHNDLGVGGLENGAPSLADQVWIYGGDRKTLMETLRNGRAGHMPHWSDRLTAEEIRMLTLYVVWAGSENGSE